MLGKDNGSDGVFEAHKNLKKVAFPKTQI